MPSIYIFAGGDNTRWNQDYSKEIAEVDNMPILARTIWQVRGLLKLEPVVVSHKRDVIDVAIANRCAISNTQHNCLVDSIVHQYWTNRNAVLLGDVYYTDRAIGNIFSQWSFAYGTSTELFAIRWVNPADNVHEAFQAAIRHWRNEGGRGKLWEVFRALHQKPLDKHWIGGSLTFIEDKTTDFNTFEEYEKFLNRKKI